MMRTVEEQQAIVRGLATVMPTETLKLSEARGRVLAADVYALVSVPPFTNSSMDGFAVRAADVANAPVVLEVVADVPAGATELPTIGPGQAARTMTGAPIAYGADAVIAVEDTDQPRGEAPLPSHVEIRKSTTRGNYIRPEGQDLTPGTLVLGRGANLSSAALSSIASVGHSTVEVFVRPRVAVISTGDELVAPGETLRPGQIPDSNSFLVEGLAKRFGGISVGTFRASDTPESFKETFEKAAAAADVVVTTGGVSAGAFDVVKATLDADFAQVAMQPGKPQGVGRIDVGGRTVTFMGLPGNPVSVFVSAWVFLRELIQAMTGRESEWLTVHMPALENWGCPAGRRQYIPLIITGDGVRPSHAGGSGSHLVASLAKANALGVVPAEVDSVAAGDLIEVRLV